jgi:hypothetical protein
VISQIILEHLGWEVKDSTYTKGEDKIVYDGCDWFLNGEKVNSMDDINKKAPQM